MNASKIVIGILCLAIIAMLVYAFNHRNVEAPTETANQTQTPPTHGTMSGGSHVMPDGTVMNMDMNVNTTAQ